MFSDAIEAAVASPTQPCLIQFQLVQDIHNQPACIYFHRRSGYGRGGRYWWSTLPLPTSDTLPHYPK